MNYDKNNIFAKILRNEADCVKVYEDSKVLAFMDVMPQAPGHTLVIPKFETTNLINLPDEFLEPILKVTKNIANAMVHQINSGNNSFNQLEYKELMKCSKKIKL